MADRRPRTHRAEEPLKQTGLPIGEDGHLHGFNTELIAYEYRSFSDILSEWIAYCGSLENFLEETDLGKVGITGEEVLSMITNPDRPVVDLGQYVPPEQIAELNKERKRPSLKLGFYLASIIPDELQVSSRTFFNRVRKAQIESRQKIDLDKEQFHELRNLRLKRMSRSIYSSIAEQGPAQAAFQDWIENKLTAIAHGLRPDEDINIQKTLVGICRQMTLVSDGNIQLAPDQIWGTEAIEEDLELKAEALAAFLTGSTQDEELKAEALASSPTSDTAVDDYQRCFELARDAWEEKKQKNSFSKSDSESLAKMLRYLRLSAGMTQKQMAEAVGVNEASIAVYERNAWPPPKHVLEQYKAYFFEPEDDGNALLDAAHKVAEAYVSTVKPFHIAFSQLVRLYGNPELFLEQTGLAGYITTNDVELLENGTPPSEELAHYLSCFVPGSIMTIYSWNRSAALSIVLHPDKDPIGFAEGMFAEARSALLKHTAENSGINRPLANVLLKVRLCAGLTLEEMAARHKVRPLQIVRWESGDVPADLTVFDRYKKITGLVDQDVMFIHHSALDVLLHNTSVHQPMRASTKNRVITLLGHDPSDKKIPDLCGDTPIENYTSRQMDNAELRALVRDGFLRGYEYEGLPNPWPDVVKKIREDLGVSQAKVADDVYNAVVADTVTKLEEAGFAFTAREKAGLRDMRLIKEGDWYEWEHGLKRPMRLQQIILRTAFGLDILPGMTPDPLLQELPHERPQSHVSKLLEERRADEHAVVPAADATTGTVLSGILKKRTVGELDAARSIYIETLREQGLTDKGERAFNAAWRPLRHLNIYNPVMVADAINGLTFPEPEKENKREFIVSLIPDLDSDGGREWLDQQLGKGIGADTFSVFNPDFLEALPVKRRPGWVMHTLMKRSGLDRIDVRRHTRMSDAELGSVLSGKTVINERLHYPRLVDLFKTKVGLTESEEEILDKAVKEDAAERQKNRSRGPWNSWR